MNSMKNFNVVFKNRKAIVTTEAGKKSTVPKIYCTLIEDVFGDDVKKLSTYNGSLYSSIDYTLNSGYSFNLLIDTKFFNPKEIETIQAGIQKVKRELEKNLREMKKEEGKSYKISFPKNSIKLEIDENILVKNVVDNYIVNFNKDNETKFSYYEEKIQENLNIIDNYRSEIESMREQLAMIKNLPSVEIEIS